MPGKLERAFLGMNPVILLGMPSLSEPEASLAEAKRIILSKLERHPAAVFLYGSRAKGTARRTSDIDIAILPQTPLPAWVLSEIREALEESHIPYQVDLMDLSTADPSFRERILQEGISWTASKSESQLPTER